MYWETVPEIPQNNAAVSTKRMPFVRFDIAIMFPPKNFGMIMNIVLFFPFPFNIKKRSNSQNLFGPLYIIR